MKRMLILLSVFGLLLGACGGGDKKSDVSSDDDTATTVKDEDGGDDSASGSEADGALKAKLLTASDLPAGFKRTKAEERDPEEADEDDTCPELTAISKEHPGEREAEADFERGDPSTGKAVFVNEQIARFADEDEADELFTAFESAIKKCDAFEDTDEDGLKTNGSFEKIDFAKAGDDTYAASLTLKQDTGDGQTASLEGTFVTLREGKHLIILVAIGFGDELPKAEVEAVAKKAVARV